MNRYNTYGLAPHASNSPTCPTGFNQGFKTERHEERASLSGSEDGNYALYGDIHKADADIEEDANMALTSQTLNADGTPKRPMNAFMIFARRRRPQVSSENQAMRTGEISKLLSKEWVAMPAHEKQFYLEQAKQLKDTFNSKYPDYVYRRRPNNSRKRRRSDSSIRPMDHSFMADNADELLGSGDLDVSPIDPDDHIDPMAYSRSSHSVGQGFVDHPKYGITQSRSSGPPFSSSDGSYRSNGQFEPRMSYGPSSNGTPVERFMQAPPAQPRHLLQQPDLNYPYPQSSGFNDIAPQGWPSRLERLQPTWLGSNNRQSGGRQAPYSPSTPSSTWSPSGPTTPSSTSPNYFPTLNTPFYPGQPSVADYEAISSPTHSHPMSTPSPLYEPLSQQPNLMSKEYAPRVYGSSGAIQSGNSSYAPPLSSRLPLSYSERNLPPVQTTNTEYANSQPSSSSSSSGHGPPGFWSRE